MNRIFAHRGLWSQGGPHKNSHLALRGALEAGFSLELDLRDHNGEIVVSHDPVSGVDNPVPYSDLLTLAIEFPGAALALNIKSDGLAGLLAIQQPDNPHFFFDMSVPETRQYEKHDLQIAARLSEYEPLKDQQAKIFWVDSFFHDLNDNELSTLIQGTQDPSLMVFVSPELHGRDRNDFWRHFKRVFLEHDFITICTDYPLEFLETIERGANG